MHDPKRVATAMERAVWYQSNLLVPGTKPGMTEDIAVLAAEVTRLKAFNFLDDLRDEHIPWSIKTFGPGDGHRRICKHIEKELDEIRARPTDVTEWMDVVILALDGAWRAGYEAEEVLLALLGKMKIIRGREYPTPTDDDEPCEHIKSPNPGGET